MNIVLTGFMASGKTAISKAISEISELIFLDTDEVIVERTGMTIEEIFENMGEEGFREIEHNIIKEISSFVGARVLTLILDMLIMFMMVTTLGINDKVSKLVVQVVVTILNYVFSKIFVFKKA